MLRSAHVTTAHVADHVAGSWATAAWSIAFGLCGHTNISLLAALERRRRAALRDHASRAGRGPRRRRLCARVGRPGSSSSTSGPGMTNAVTGVATAAFDSIPMLVIAGDVPSYYEGRGPHQEFNLRRDADQVSVYEPFVKRAWRVRRADQVPRTLARAWDLALAGRPGPVLVSIPMDILAEPLEADVVPPSPVERARSQRERPRADRRASCGAPRGRCSSRAGARVARRRRCAARGAGRRAGRPHAHGHRRPAAGPPPARRGRGLLGLAVRQPPGVGGGRHPRGRHPLPRDRQQQLGAGRHLPHPAHAAHPHRHRPARAGAQLPHDDRGHGRRRAGPRGHPRGLRRARRRTAATTGRRCARNARRSWRRAGRTPRRRSCPCSPSASSPTSAGPRRTPSS